MRKAREVTYMKHRKIWLLLFCVFCLTGCGKMENEIGEIDQNQKILDEKVTETDYAQKIEETTLQETYESEPESQEDMQWNKEQANLHEIDSFEKINKCMVPEQSFDVFLDDWGDVTFVSCNPLPGQYGDFKVASFYLVKDDQILYKFPYRFKNNSLEGYYTGSFDSVGAVSFRDINNDKKDDIIIITYYTTGAGPTGMVPRPLVTIYLAAENEFCLAEDMITDVEANIIEQDRTIANIYNFLIEKEPIMQEQWEDTYRDIISNIDDNLVDPYSLRTDSNEYYYIAIHDFDNSGEPELIIGDSVSVAIFTYTNGTSKKVADLYEPVNWGGINGLCYKDNKLLLVNAGSDGCGYVGFTYDKGKYLTGIYDDYNPEVATINEKKIKGEEFRKQFNLTEFRESDNSLPRIKLWENVGSIPRIKIGFENKGTLKIEDEEMVIDDLDFSVLQW